MPSLLSDLPLCTRRSSGDRRQLSGSNIAYLLGLLASNLLGQCWIGQQAPLARGWEGVHRSGQRCERRRELRLQ